MLTLQETTDIFLNFTAKQKPSLLYPVKSRVGMKPQTCHRFQSSAYRSNQWRWVSFFCIEASVSILHFLMTRLLFNLGKSVCQWLTFFNTSISIFLIMDTLMDAVSHLSNNSVAVVAELLKKNRLGDWDWARGKDKSF